MNTRRIFFSVIISASLVIFAWFGVGEALSRPASRIVGSPPADLLAVPVLLNTPNNETVSGWFIPASQRRGAVLLLHGVRSDRRSMVERARLLSKQGYAVFLIDLPAHGESSGKRITFGLREAVGVKVALDFLRKELPGESIGVIGVSSGAASLVLAKVTPAPNVVVLESMYPTIADAVSARLVDRLGFMGNAIAPILLLQLPLRLGITADELRPIAEISTLNAPVLIASGTLDKHTPLAESRHIFEAAVEPKEF